MAIAETHLASQFNKPGYDVIDHHTYVICGDGDLQEGVALEAISLAGHLGLGKLIVLFDSNDIQLDGKTDLAFSDDHKKKFESMNWHYQKVSDGNDINAITKAIKKPKNRINQASLKSKQSLAYGTSLAGTSNVMVHQSVKKKASNLERHLTGHISHLKCLKMSINITKPKSTTEGQEATVNG